MIRWHAVIYVLLGLEILSESMNDEEKQEILDVIEGLKLLA